MKNYKYLTLIIILVASAALRFYNLMHDYPYFFNPDERNMASAITRFRLPGNFNPHFFAYGQFPLYLAFTSDVLTRPGLAVLQGLALNNLNNLSTDFPSAIYWLRFYSALFSTFTVYLVYLISRKLLSEKTALIAALTTAFLPGLIQSAHFGTTESLLTFFFMMVVYLSIKLLNAQKYLILNTKYTILLSLAIGLSLGSKLTGVFFFVPPLIAILIKIIKSKNTFGYLRICLLVLIGSIFFFILSSPYNLIEPENFRSAVFGYETDVATGKYEAFYTRQFVDSVPILFQAEKIFPFVLGWPVFILGTIGLFIIFPKKVILISSFLIYFIPNAFLFAKWTRFMTPILPFFTIFAAFVISKIQKLNNSFAYLLICLFVIASILPGLMFMSIYTHEDTRVTASKWIYENIPDNSYILSETANVVDIPLGLPTSDQRLKTNDYTVISFDFYHLDENPSLFEELLNHLEKADYILIPSRRIFANYPKLPQKFPLVTRYYQLLFSGNLGFEKVKEIKVLNDEQAEETFTVFDHPVIRIYQKVKPFTKKEYTSLFKA